MSRGTYLQIYPSNLERASRMQKIATSVHPHIDVDATEMVGTAAPHLPPTEEIAPGISIRRIAGTTRTGNLGRVLRVLLWQPRVYRHYRGRRLAAVACHNLWILPLCWHLARRADAPLIYNPHELETETGTMRGLKKWAAQRIESRYISRCSLISCVNESIAGWYAKRYGIEQPIAVSNVPRVEEANPRIRETLGIRDDEMLYIHTGNLVEGRNIPVILEAFSNSPHHVVFMGDGPLRDVVAAARQEHPNIHQLPPVEPDLVVAHVRGADVGLCLTETEVALSHQFASPNKLMESLLAPRPVLCAPLVEAKRILEPKWSSWVLEDPAQDLSGALERITKDSVQEFLADPPRLGTWDDMVQPLVAGYSSLLTGERSNSASKT